jgi:UDP-N-acetylglucosamine 2-epimerase (non-hydrolysing)
MSHRICCIIGTRPEMLKMAPVVTALQKIPGLIVTVLLTGQHKELLDQASGFFDLPITHNLDMMQPNQSLSALSARLMEKMAVYFEQTKPDMVVAQGDTTTTFITSQVCFYQKIPFAYVESGLRSGNFYRPFPEEMNRQFASKMAALNFAPTDISKQNLLNDGIAPETIFVTGNTVIDTLLNFAARPHPMPVKTSRKTILVTCHRRENFGSIFIQICDALKQIVEAHEDVEIVYPVHPNPNVKEVAYARLQHERIHLVSPLDYPDLVAVMKNCYLVLTDSGGLQEEAPALGKPVLVMRTETERPEGVYAGTAKMVGVESASIVAAVNTLLCDKLVYQSMTLGISPFGDGHAAPRIAAIIQEYFLKTHTSDLQRTDAVS